MHTRFLGNTGVKLSVIGFGAASVIGGRDYGHVKRNEDEAVSTIIRGLECGITWIDTAPKYADGRAEEMVGRALHEWGEEVFVATKCGYPFDEEADRPKHNLKRETILAEVELSLRRLGRERIDLYQIHWPMPDEDIEEAFQAISDLIDHGKVRFAGVSNFSVDQMKRVAGIRPIDSNQPAYNLLDRRVEKTVLPYCKEQNISILAYSPLQSGLLTGAFDRKRIEALPAGDWRRHLKNYSEPLLTRNLRIIGELETLAQEYGLSLPQLAIAWTLANEAVTAAIVGGRTRSQIEGTVVAGSVNLDSEIMAKIDAIMQSNDEGLSISDAFYGEPWVKNA